ncbi:MAG TPA: amidohydrolase/deacetylase family metallohydrolase [Cyclobacteriaceae bacterium]|nr:amidohydrolase/deacetylase family metallohydrolase [Cyclobacteriaceae bacterium]
MRKGILLLFALVAIIVQLPAQTLDILIKNGHVIDAKNGRDGVMDVAIRDEKIVLVAPSIDQPATQVIDASGMYVVPGLIDIHGHHFFGTEPDRYLSNGFSALPPDGFTLRSGVTTVVDVGGAGWRNFATFKAQTIDQSTTRVLSFLNIVGGGMSGGQREQNIEDMDAAMTAKVAKENKEYVVGIKLAHFEGNTWVPTERAVEAGRLANIPVMVDFGGSDPPLSLETLFMDKLRPGDIFTHCYAHVKGRMPLVNNGKLEPFVLKAQQRGIIFDVGHGGGSFAYEQAVPAIQQGFKPNTISTDLHTSSMNKGMKDMLNIMSKLLNIGLSLNEVITCATWTPAQVIQREELGNLDVGAPADVVVLSLDRGDFGFVDVRGFRIPGDRKLTCQLTVANGEVEWDLNGLAAKPFQK